LRCWPAATRAAALEHGDRNAPVAEQVDPVGDRLPPRRRAGRDVDAVDRAHREVPPHARLPDDVAEGRVVALVAAADPDHLTAALRTTTAADAVRGTRPP
jgi:hypothetical protein